MSCQVQKKNDCTPNGADTDDFHPLSDIHLFFYLILRFPIGNDSNSKRRYPVEMKQVEPVTDFLKRGQRTLTIFFLKRQDVMHPKLFLYHFS